MNADGLAWDETFWVKYEHPGRRDRMERILR